MFCPYISTIWNSLAFFSFVLFFQLFELTYSDVVKNYLWGVGLSKMAEQYVGLKNIVFHSSVHVFFLFPNFCETETPSRRPLRLRHHCL